MWDEGFVQKNGRFCGSGDLRMIHADLQGKTHIREDVHTSNCLGLLHLLPDSDMIGFLSGAETIDGTRIDLSCYDHVQRLQFWPWLPQGGEPDVLAELQERDGRARLVLIIEAKHGASKSGGAPWPEALTSTPENTESSGVMNHDHPTCDQLAKYWRAASKNFPHDVALIYLTHHRSLPTDDMRESLREAGPDARIFWLSRFDLYRWVTCQLEMRSGRPTSEARILKTLRHYLSAQGYTCFLGWSLSLVPANCRLGYSHAYALGHRIRHVKPQMSHYTRTYGIDRRLTPARPLCFYQARQEEP
jgi:hypothetical protein